ncbi:MAG: hypothetical protein NC131_17600 [Roseburia sp.]|nr:hypothetical protein [Roseburia sp.]
MIRATTGGVLKSYRRNLMNSFIATNKARETVLTQRTFNSYAEDPAAASKAFRLRKSRMATESQYNVCNDTYSKFQTGFSCLMSVDKILDTDTECMNTLSTATLKWLNDPTGDAREQLTKVLDQMSQTIVQCLNQKYGDNFIFAGADGHNVPFEIKTVDGSNRLFYRGVPVDAAEPNVVTQNGANVTVDAAGNLDPNGGCYICADSISTMKADDFDAMDAADQPQVMRDASGNAVRVDEKGNFDPNGDYVMCTANIKTMTQEDYDEAMEDVEKLEYLVNEKCFVDIGLGFQEANGKLIEASAFNDALNGLTFLGYGLDSDGDPKNIYSIVQRMTELRDSVPEGGSWDDVWPEFHRLVGKLETASSEFKTEFANMDAGTTKLENNLKLLEDNVYNLREQYSELEDEDMAAAISSFIWAQYCYNAALKVGNSVLSESLMDYLS